MTVNAAAKIIRVTVRLLANTQPVSTVAKLRNVGVVRRRFEIFKRDEYRCQLCGAKADDGAALHVDHRVAVAKGGSNADENLWTLCDKCNLGKSDADL